MNIYTKHNRKFRLRLLRKFIVLIIVYLYGDMTFASDGKIVLAQGKSDINGPHQGAWIDTPDGKQDWFIHFQDVYAYGRAVLLQPMRWVND